MNRLVRIIPTGAAKLLLLGAGILLITSTVVFADPITLICNLTSPVPYAIENGPSTAELNEAKGSVVFNFSGYHTTDGHFADRRTTGPAHATFGAGTISFSFSVPGMDRRFWNFRLNRVTGVMENDAKWMWNCHAGQKQF